MNIFNASGLNFYYVVVLEALSVLAFMGIVVLIWALARTILSDYRVQRRAERQTNAGTALPNGGTVQQRYRMGFAFLVATLAGLIGAYVLPAVFSSWKYAYVAAGIYFILVSTGLYFRLRLEALGNWKAVWAELVDAGNPDESRRYRRISALVVSEWFALICFVALYKLAIPQHPEIVLGFFLALLWLIATGAAEKIIQRIARYCAYSTVIGLVAVLLIWTLRGLFLQYLEERIPVVVVFSIGIALFGLLMLRWEGTRKIATAMLGISAALIFSVLLDFTSLGNHPTRGWLKNVREYQNEGTLPDKARERFLPPDETPTSSSPASTAAPAEKVPEQQSASTDPVVREVIHTERVIERIIVVEKPAVSRSETQNSSPREETRAERSENRQEQTERAEDPSARPKTRNRRSQPIILSGLRTLNPFTRPNHCTEGLRLMGACR